MSCTFTVEDDETTQTKEDDTVIMIHMVGKDEYALGACLVDHDGTASYVTLEEVEAQTGRSWESWLADNNNMEEIDHRNLDMKPTNTTLSLRRLLNA
jgi:hypothetical protein